MENYMIKIKNNKKNLDNFDPIQRIIYDHSTFDSGELNPDEIKVINTFARKFFGHDIIGIKYEEGERKIEISAENHPKPKSSIRSLLSDLFTSLVKTIISRLNK